MKTALNHLKTKVFIIGILSLVFLGCEKEIQLNPVKDWPQFKKDNYRSANATTQLDLATLGEDWQYNAPQMPVPAWYGPAKEDTYAVSGPLPSMRDYDLAYYPIVVGGKLYYGSTADNAIHCLDAKTGKEEWTYTTGGPIRVAPVFHDGKLYFGSDDGYAYCIKAHNGKLVWRFTPVEDQTQKLMHNNALISFWPIRTGILIEDGIAYFGASLLPWKDAYFCAINAETGKPEGEGAYVKRYGHENLSDDETLTFEGAMASTGSKIIQPRGRISPIFISKKTGEIKGQLAGTGGCFVLVTPEKNIIHANNTRAKGIAETIGEFAERKASKGKENANFMSFKDGKEMVVSGDFSYILTDNSISAYNRTTKKVVWLKRNYKAHRIIISGDVLYVGATDAVYAVSTKNGYPLWEASVKGAVYALAVADDALFASTGEGHMYCFRSGKSENKLLAENTDKSAEIDDQEKEVKETVVGDLALTAGPFANSTGKNKVEIQFFTETPIQCKVKWTDFNNEEHTFSEKEATTSHKIIIDKVRKDFIYQYQIVSGDQKSALYEYDNFFNYEEEAFETNASEKSGLVSKVETLYLKNKGIAVIFGTENENQALEIASVKGVKVMLFDTSASKVQKLREKLQKTGTYGGKIVVYHVSDLSNLPITGDIANVVMVNGTSNTTADEVIRLIKPEGVAILNNDDDYKDWLEASSKMWQVNHSDKDGLNVLFKAPYDNTGEWSHQYGLADNTAFGGESLWGSTGTNDFEIQWMGRPGPRFQTDRSGRKPSPLAIDNKMFVQGRERIIAVDAYNGNVYWAKEIPGLNRMNVLRDCSNWVADNDFLYVATKQNLLKINNENGKIEHIIPVQKSSENPDNDWGYISVHKNLIVGSAVPKGSGYTNYYGGAGWYDAQSGPLTDKVVSYKLFAKDKNNLTDTWTYENPSTYIINPTITISGDKLSFVESRNPRFKLTKEQKADPSIFKNLFLVTLDINTGKEVLRRPIDIVPGVTTIFMASSKDQNVVLTANGGYYYIYNFDANTGTLNWEQKQRWFATHHGGHFSKPAIVNNRLIVKPAMYRLDTGELMEEDVPKAGHGCASYALSEQSVFYRGGSVTQFNFDTNKFTQWSRLRPDCWISTIPAQGLVLSPEAGGGCSCGNWLETSMVFAPKSRAPISFIYETDKFIDEVSVEIKSRDASNNAIYYTLDGTEPTKESTKYSEAIVIDKSSELKAVIYVERDGKEVSFVRSRNFERTYPSPKIVETPQLINGNWQFTLERVGNSGTIHYTTDGSSPNKNSPKYTTPVNFLDKTLVKAKTIWETNGKVVESKETSFEMLIPELLASVDADAKLGIKRYYYKENKASNDLPELDKIKPRKTEVVDSIKGIDFIRDQMFALRFEGYIKVPEDGMYTLTSKSRRSYDFVTLQEEKLQSTGNNEASKIFPLQKGLHALKVDHFVGRVGSDYHLFIEGPNMPKQEITATMLFH